MLMVVELPAYLTAVKLTGDNKIECTLCRDKLLLKDMRNHVGKHVLFSLRGTDENINFKPGVKVRESYSLRV